MTTRQQSLFPHLYEDLSSYESVKVVSIPQRSPFLYPGGKTWFVPVFRNWIANCYPKPKILVEPFVGGGIVSLTGLFEDLASKVVMVEIDDDIAAVWKAVVNNDAEWLAKRILDFDLTQESATKEISQATVDSKEMAFKTILKDRTLQGGILAERSGVPKRGGNDKGFRSRWDPATLAGRFKELNVVADRIAFRHEDGMKVMREYSFRRDMVFFIDPPYAADGKKDDKRLCRHCNLNHEQLFALCKSLAGDFLMTYDNEEGIKALARRHGFQMRLVPMKKTRLARMEKLVIGKNLSWMDRFPAMREPASPA